MTRALLILLLLGACASPPRPELVHLPLPETLLSCAPEPAAPSKTVAGRRDPKAAARWLIEALDAGADCRGKLDELRTLEAGRRKG